MIIGNLLKEQEVLNWLVRQKESDEIEDVTPEILDALIQRSDYLAVLFCKENIPKTCCFHGMYTTETL